jgi:hypothetical protein
MQAQLAEAGLQLAKEQEATRKAEGDLGALRSKLLHVSGHVFRLLYLE